MAGEDTEKTDGAAEGEAAAEEGGKKKKGLKKILLIVGPILLIIIIVAVLFLTGILGGKKKEAAKEGEPGQELTEEHGEEGGKDKKKDGKEGAEKPTYYDLPEMLVNMDSKGKKQHFLKISVSIELAKAEDVHAVEGIVPKVIDQFQIFLREMRIEDLRGSAGIYRLRQELLARLKPAVAPIEVKDVLFRQLLIQ